MSLSVHRPLGIPGLAGWSLNASLHGHARFANGKWSLVDVMSGSRQVELGVLDEADRAAILAACEAKREDWRTTHLRHAAESQAMAEALA